LRRSAKLCPLAPDRADPTEGGRTVEAWRRDLNCSSRESPDRDVPDEIEGSAGVTVCDPDDVFEPVDERVEVLV